VPTSAWRGAQPGTNSMSTASAVNLADDQFILKSIDTKDTKDTKVRQYTNRQNTKMNHTTVE
jgi:hypothetical protein